MRALWLPDVLRAAGLTVREYPGWETRGSSSWGPLRGLICHATAGSRTATDADEMRVLWQTGSTSAPAPISQLYLARDGTWWVGASGLCYHVLVGDRPGPHRGWGNTALLGVEAANDNRGEPWPAVQRQAYERGVAAICRHQGWPASVVVGHAEHQTGKTDPFGINMTDFRARVAALIEEDDVQLTDMVDLPSWAATEWPSGGTADGRLQVETILGSGYSHARRASERSLEAAHLARANGTALAKVQAEQAQLATQLAGLTAAFQALAAGGTSVDTTAVLNAVGQLAGELGGRIAALEQALAAAEAERDALRGRLAEALVPEQG